jgi:HEAT repeat protein
MESQRVQMLVRRTIAGFAWLLAASGAGALAEGEIAPAVDDRDRLGVEVDQGLLTLRAREAPLADVLAAIAERAGFEMSVHGAADTPVTADLSAVPLQQGLQQLLGSGSVVFRYDRPRGHPARRLVEVRAHLSAAAAHQRERAAVPAADINAEAAGRVGSGHEDHPAISIYDPLEDRLAFARTQARLGRTKSAEDVMTLLLEDEHANVRGLAAAALGRVGGAEAGEALVEALSDHDWRVRQRAVRALGQAWGYRAVAPLAELLTEERARTVRRAAAYTLSRIEGEPAREALATLQDDPDPRVRRIATFALEAGAD